MGLEGAASTAYFGCLSGLVPPEVAFDGRSRRPPKDLANAALSYAYAILLAECTGALPPPGSSPRSGCCTPPPTSAPASPWTSTRQARLAAALEGWGYRLQESVFQLRLEPAELDEVRRQVTEIINQADDVIHLYPLCDSCLARSEVHGTAPALDDAGLYRGVW